jgi:hypothetical protein
VADLVRRAELLTVLAIFGTLAQPDIDPFAIIGRQQMQHSPFYHQIVNEGRKETRREDTLAVLAKHLGADTAAQVADAGNAVEDLAELERPFAVALRCDGIDEFCQALHPAAPHRAAPRPRRRR